jgi:hypothetical protein|tara:strand:+ start:190 stop:480 length:291 start_codon:yes stop_codon:yes gene_type:complete
MKKAFREKLADVRDFPRVQVIEPGMAKKWGGGTILFSSPLEINELKRSVPKGKLLTINQIRETFAMTPPLRASSLLESKRMFAQGFENALVKKVEP